MTTTQISANISSATRERLERYVRARGMKKGYVIEQALLYHLQALSELPEEVLIPPRIVVDAASGTEILDRLDAGEGPNPALTRLFKDGPDEGSD